MRATLLLGLFLLLTPVPGRATVGTEFNGLASFGVGGGLMRWLADEDASSLDGQAAQVRPIGKAVFRYRFSTNWLAALEAGYGWNGYAESGDRTLIVIPLTLGMERRLGDMWGLTMSGAGGAGIYVWGLRQDGQFLRDPETTKTIQAVDPGLYAGGTGEFHLSNHVTSTVHWNFHYIFSTHKSDYPTMLGENDLFTELRIGVNYYFSPYEGLVWGE
ncbi:MAG: hypothetical protein V1774_08535 [Candidatus Eisenbacteria bacterium]